MSRTLVLCLLSLVAPRVAAAADWRFWIDCHDLGLEDTDSPDDVIGDVIRAGKVLETERTDVQDDNGTDLGFGAKGTCPYILRNEGYNTVVAKGAAGSSRSAAKGVVIRLKATGSNALWIDRALFAEYCGDFFGDCPKFTWGVDGKSGWCLSTDTGDSFGKDRQDGGCHKCLEFRTNDEKAYGC